MNRKGISNTGLAVILIVLIISVNILFTGCAGQGFKPRSMAAVSRYFHGDVNTVWTAIIQSLEGVSAETNDKAKGLIVTQWVKGWATNKDMGLLLEGRWQERYRLIIKVSSEQGKTYVSVNALIEQKAPGGSQAYRWDRVPSDGTLEQNFLKKLESMLAN